MGLLTDPSSSKKLSRYSKLLLRFKHPICLVLYIAGVAWFFALGHESLSSQTYFSENALLPGLVLTEMRTEFVQKSKAHFDDLSRERETHRKDTPHAWIISRMKRIGLETHTHNFTLHYPFGGEGGKTFAGKNVYGILRAPRIASTEAIVISTPYRFADSVHNDISAGLAVLLSYAEFARKQKHWSKDLIFLVTEQEQLGAYAWLQAYHSAAIEEVALDCGKLDARAGAIQAAINLELESLDIENVEIKLEGLNGQLPNLDLVNLVQRLGARQGISTEYKPKVGKSQRRISLEDNWLRMLSMVMSQAMGVPTGNHGLFHKYGIEAVTLEGHKRSMRYNQANTMSVLRMIEGISRSLNNLLERFHQSFFFYLLIRTDRFVSIGDYMPCLGLMAGALFVKALITWLELHDKDPQREHNYISVCLTLVLAHSPSLLLLNNVPALAFIGNKLHGLIGLHTEKYLGGVFALILFVSVIAPLNARLQSVEILKIAALLELGTFLVVVGLQNFSLGFSLCVFITPFALFVEPGLKGVRRFLKGLFIVAHPVMVVFNIVFALTCFQFSELAISDIFKRAVGAAGDVVTFALVDSLIYGNWLYDVVVGVLLPIWTIFWLILWCKAIEPENGTEATEKVLKKD